MSISSSDIRSAEVRGLPDDIVLDHLTAADDQTGGDPDPHVQRFGLLELRHALDHRQPASYRALGVVLVGLRISEIDQNSVAHVTRDKAAKPFDRLGDATMIGAKNPAQILGIVAHRQGRRADEIAKHHGQLPALSGRRWTSCIFLCDRYRDPLSLIA
jgi:hypothetical protein